MEAIRALMAARRSAAGERTPTNGQARALILTGPDDLRARFTRHTPAALVAGLALLRPRPGDVAGYAVRGVVQEKLGGEQDREQTDGDTGLRPTTRGD